LDSEKPVNAQFVMICCALRHLCIALIVRV